MVMPNPQSFLQSLRAWTGAMCARSSTSLFLSVPQVLVDLRADNQRLKDENAALIRVISKLSK